MLLFRLLSSHLLTDSYREIVSADALCALCVNMMVIQISTWCPQHE